MSEEEQETNETSTDAERFGELLKQKADESEDTSPFDIGQAMMEARAAADTKTTSEEQQLAIEYQPVTEAMSRYRESQEGAVRFVIDDTLTFMRTECAALADTNLKTGLCKSLYLSMKLGAASTADFVIFEKAVAKEILKVPHAAAKTALKVAHDTAYRHIFRTIMGRDKALPDPDDIIVSAKDWRSELQFEKDKEGNIRVTQNVANVRRALTACPETAGMFRFNELAGKIELHGPVPWNKEGGPEVREIRDTDSTGARVYFNEAWQFPAKDNGMRIHFARETMKEAQKYVAEENAYDPALEWLEALEWDRTPRMANVLNKVFDCEDTEYGRLVSRVLMTSIAARQVEPGCKQDISVILEGDEGILKSTFCAELVPMEAWYSDYLPQLADKDAMQTLRGKLVIEVAEMAAVSLTKSWDSVKAFLSRRIDKFRPSYGEFEVSVPRRVTFVITTNEDHSYLRGSTGLRRFLPIYCNKSADMKWWLANRNQVLAEAYYEVKAFLASGKKGAAGQWWPTNEEEAMAKDERFTRLGQDDWFESVREYVCCDTAGRPADQVLERTYPKQILFWLGLREADLNKRENQNRVQKILDVLGYEQDKHPSYKLPMRITGTDKVSARWWNLKDHQKLGAYRAHLESLMPTAVGEGNVTPMPDRKPTTGLKGDHVADGEFL